MGLGYPPRVDMATYARRLLSAYDGLLTRHRLLTSTVSGAAMSYGGDAVVQSSSPEPHDVGRAVAFTIFGGVLTGPINYIWLDALEKAVRRLAPAGGLHALAAKVTIQSVFFQPLVYLPCFFVTNGLVRGWCASDAYEHVRAEYGATLVRLWALWTPAVIFTFGWLPVRSQAVFFSGVGFAWTAILSWTAGAGPRLAEPGGEGRHQAGASSHGTTSSPLSSSAARLRSGPTFG